MDRLALLQRTFPELGDAELLELERAAEMQVYPAGAILCRQGEPGTRLFIIGRGEAEIFVQADDNHEILVKRVYPADYFGEMALLSERPRAATVRATTPCLTLEIERETFIPIADHNPALLRALVKQLSDHLRNNDRSIINELRQKNLALQMAYADLAEQERLRTEFIATLSHELRTPLTSAQGFLHLITRGKLEGAGLESALESVTRNVEKMVHLINNLLVLYEMHLISPEFQVLSLAQVVQEALAEAQALLAEEEQLPVILESAADLPAIHGDWNGLLLAIRSLIENAIKFSPEKTPVRIRIYRLEESAIRVDVTDQGVGIPAEWQERIFDPFVRLEGAGANRLFSGLGVGLAIAKFIVERHGGRIEVDSAPGRGSTFSVLLPCQPENGARNMVAGRVPALSAPH